MEKDAYYFPHDSNARNDINIKQMRSVYKGEGFGWYWILVEMLREDANYKLCIQGKYIWNAFADELQCDAETAKQFINDCIHEFHLFETDDISFWSNSLIRRMKKKDEKSEKARESARTRWSKERKANAIPTHSDSNAKRKEESKVEEIKEEIINNDDDSAAENYAVVLEQEFGRPITPNEIQTLNAYIDQDGMEEAVVCHAIKKARSFGSPYLSYIKTTLNNYLAGGHKTLTAVIIADEKFEKNKEKTKVTHIRGKPEKIVDPAKVDKYKNVYMS